MKYSHAKVKTLDTCNYPGRPVRVEIDGKGMDIESVVDHWHEAYNDPSFYPQEYFKVITSDKKIYILRYCTLFESWWGSELGDIA
ncbi:MAG: hypothetical protein JXM72_04500 [Deltaproteobacteria bacterium]|nr:hypothetical protein [Deltaproteobacteria bacterium]